VFAKLSSIGSGATKTVTGVAMRETVKYVLIAPLLMITVPFVVASEISDKLQELIDYIWEY
jgi:hypothetical protein